MTVFIAHAEKDAPAAEALEKYLERRGLFVTRETGEKGFRFAQARDAVVVVWSRETVFSPYRLLTEKRALDAWADQQLIFVKLDHHVAPLGLRDLSAIDAAFEPQREIAWAAVAKAAQDLQMGRRTEPPPIPGATTAPGLGGADQSASGGRSAEESEVLGAEERKQHDRKREAPPPTAPPQQQRVPEDKAEAGFWYAAAALLAIPAGAFASLAMGLRDPAWPILGSGLALAAVWQLAKWPDWWRFGPKTRSAAPPPAAAKPAPSVPAPQPGPDAGVAAATFISYAHADAGSVIPVVDAVAAGGRPVWIDRAGIQAGEGWAGEIVRAIKAAGGVVVMCSAKAFESDHVRREIYLADRYKKPMLPVFLEEAAPPEDFEYFFAGVQWLKLFEAPEAERAAALEKAWPKPPAV